MLIPQERKLNRFFFIVYFSLLTQGVAVAATNVKASSPTSQAQINFSQFHPVLTVSGGMAIARIGRSQTLTMDGDFTVYQYRAKHSNSGRATWGIFFGSETLLPAEWLFQLGLGFYNPNTFASGFGTLTQGVDAESADAFGYSYKVKSKQLLIEGKLLKTKENYHPYISLGLGAAFNKSSDYDVNVPPFLTFTPRFTNHKTTNFTYKLGAGVDIDVQKNCRLGIGYRFAGLGAANLGTGFIDVSPFTKTLTQSQLYAQEVMVQLSYLIS